MVQYPYRENKFLMNSLSLIFKYNIRVIHIYYGILLRIWVYFGPFKCLHMKPQKTLSGRQNNSF